MLKVANVVQLVPFMQMNGGKIKFGRSSTLVHNFSFAFAFLLLMVKRIFLFRQIA